MGFFLRERNYIFFITEIWIHWLHSQILMSLHITHSTEKKKKLFFLPDAVQPPQLRGPARLPGGATPTPARWGHVHRRAPQ